MEWFSNKNKCYGKHPSNQNNDTQDLKSNIIEIHKSTKSDVNSKSLLTSSTSEKETYDETKNDNISEFNNNVEFSQQACVDDNQQYTYIGPGKKEQDNSQISKTDMEDSKLNKETEAKYENVIGNASISPLEVCKMSRNTTTEFGADKNLSLTQDHKNSGNKSMIKNLPSKLSLSDFEILGLLGEGAFGKVYHVIRKEDGCEYALKTIRKKDCADIKERIFRERKLMSNVDHDGVVRLHSSFQDASKLYFLMELAPNGELHSHMNNEGVLDYNEAKFFTAQIVNILEYLRDKKIWHRDLKPSNLIFDNKMHLKLADFGAAKNFNLNEASDNRNDEK